MQTSNFFNPEDAAKEIMTKSFLKSRGILLIYPRNHERYRLQVLPRQQNQIMFIRQGGKGWHLQGNSILRQEKQHRIPHKVRLHPQLVIKHLRATKSPERRHGLIQTSRLGKNLPNFSVRHNEPKKPPEHSRLQSQPSKQLEKHQHRESTWT